MNWRLKFQGVGMAIAVLTPSLADAANLPWQAARLEPGQAAAIAAAQLAVIRQHLPPAASTVIVHPLVPRDAAQHDHSAALERALRAAGYAVATDPIAAPTAQPVGVSVREMEEGVVLELTINGRNQIQFFQWNAGELRAAGPVTVREGS